MHGMFSLSASTLHTTIDKSRGWWKRVIIIPLVCYNIAVSQNLFDAAPNYFLSYCTLLQMTFRMSARMSAKYCQRLTRRSLLCKTKGDAGWLTTSRLLLESGLCIALEVNKPTVSKLPCMTFLTFSYSCCILFASGIMRAALSPPESVRS